MGEVLRHRLGLAGEGRGARHCAVPRCGGVHVGPVCAAHCARPVWDAQLLAAISATEGDVSARGEYCGFGGARGGDDGDDEGGGGGGEE